MLCLRELAVKNLVNLDEVFESMFGAKPKNADNEELAEQLAVII